MKKLIITAAFFLFSFTAQAGVYVSAGIGLNINDSKTTRNGIKNDYDNSAFYSGALGYALPILPLRAELEGFYSKSNVKEASGHMTAYGALANAYARIPVLGFYVGAGAGYASVRNKTTPVYQGIAGFEYALFGLNLGIEYRHLQSSKNIKKVGEKSRFRTDALMLKARFEF